MNQDEKKKKAAEAAFLRVLPSLNKETILGIGTGSTTNFFIEELNKAKVSIKGAVCSSEASKANLESSGIKVMELNEVYGIDVYVDGAQEFRHVRHRHGLVFFCLLDAHIAMRQLVGVV